MKKGIIVIAPLFLVAAFAIWRALPEREGSDWERSEAIGVGSGYSITLKVKPIHPILAEYEQKLEIFGGSEREGTFLGTSKLPTNTGGRVRILVFRDRKNAARLLVCDRYDTSIVELETRRVSEIRDHKEEDYEFIGAFSGRAFPLKFIPAPVWVQMSKGEKGEG